MATRRIGPWGRRVFVAALAWVAIWSAAGCGYHLVETKTPAGIGLRSLAVPPIKSTSSFPGFEGDVTEVLRQEFIAHSQVPILPREEAEAVFVGEIREIRVEPSGYRVTQSPVQGQVVSYEVTNRRNLRLRLAGRLIHRQTGQVIWEDRDMEEMAFYDVGADPLTNRYNERRALQEVAQRLARQVFAKTMERF